MKNNINQTSNHHPSNIISNILIGRFSAVKRKTSYIHNIYEGIKKTQKNH